MDVDITGDEEAIAKIEETSRSLFGSASDEVNEQADEILDEIRNTAPVRTGNYKESWKKVQVDDHAVYLVNTAEYAKHLVYPNSQMRGSPKADNPAKGIIHNVRGIIHKHQSDAKDGFIDRIKDSLF